MLHKKSEYRLQYGKLNQELRRKIWQDNIALRKSRLLSNQATHYWEYQLRDEICDCDNGETDDDEGPLPPHRLKHQNLREQYCQQPSKLNAMTQPCNDSLQNDAREKAVQTPEWDGEEKDNRICKTREEELASQMTSLTLPEAKDGRSRQASPAPALTTPRSRPRSAAPATLPSRTAKKLHTEPKRTHFVPYGWNEAKTDVGQKQTFNVKAPQKEVHDTAVHASRRRKAEMEMCLAQEKPVRPHNTRPRERTSSNSSSLWMSEYQEQFSGRGSKVLSRTSRPLSAPPAPRHPVSWRHS